MSQLDIVIPAAGPGRRMRSFGPRALLRVGDENILARQLRLLHDAYPKARVTVVLGFEAERVKRTLPKDVRAVMNVEYETTGVAHSLALGLAGGKGPALVVYGDLVFDGALIADLPTDRTAAVADISQPRMREVGMAHQGGKVLRFAYGMPTRWAQVAVLSARDRLAFQDEALKSSRKLHLTHEVFNHLLDGGMSMGVTTGGGKVVEVDGSKDLPRAKKIS